MRNITVSIREDSRAAFSNNAAFCIGTGRMGLALQQEYQEQLRTVQALCGFRHIRGHGLFCGDMSIYQPYKDAEGVEHEAYCFTYLDRVMDCYRAAGLRPFLELGFMPDQIASGEQTIFYWKGNVTPPNDEAKWVNLVTATLVHLKERYGEEEVSAWPCEVWNEPNLPGFWQNADKDAYLRLYEITAPAVKSVLPAMPVGGPAICGGEGSQGWIRDFLAFCEKKTLPVDFVSRHAYMGLSPEHRGRYLYHGMRTVDDLLAEMKESRDIIDSFPRYRGMPMHIRAERRHHRGAAGAAGRGGRQLQLLDVRRRVRGAGRAVHAVPRRLRPDGERPDRQTHAVDVPLLQQPTGRMCL